MVERVLSEEIGQLREDIETARKNDFGRRLFEAFSTEYMNSYLNEKSETSKLMKIVALKDKQLDEARVKMSKATQMIFFESVSKLKKVPEHILTDNFEIKKITKEHQTNIVRGDSKSLTIAAASIIAKVYRDELMDTLHDKYPEYGFIRNKGYGTKEHLEALHKHGPCEIHRKSFEPLKSLLKKL